MDNTLVSDLKDDRGNGDSLRILEDKKDTSVDYGMNCSGLKPKRLASLVNPQHALILNVGRIQAGKSLINGSLIWAIFGRGNTIPRHVVTLHEKYLRCCLELIHINAAKVAQCSISVNFSSVDIGIVSDGLNSAKIGAESTCDFGSFGFECLPDIGTGSLVTGSAELWIVGSIMGCRSMKNILGSPLFQKLGAFHVNPSLNDAKGLISYDLMSSPGDFSNKTLYDLRSETPISDNHKYGSETVCKRLVSMSSTDSTCSDQSFSSPCTTISEGVLQCMWNGGTPYFVFSLDNQREVYLANLSKQGAARNKGLDNVYLFHSSKSSHKEHRISDNESNLVGKMTMSTSFSICSQDSKIMETEFVLFSGMQTSRDNHWTNKGLSKKVVEAFKGSHSLKQITVSRFHRSSSMMEDSSLGPCRDAVGKSDAIDQTKLFNEQLPTNLELTAVVVRDHLPEDSQAEAGGWGLKFLRKPVDMPNTKSSETLARSVFSCSTSDCSRSMNVLIPAGCPLTVLESRSSKGGSPPTDMPNTCKLFDFSIQGPEHGSPTLTISKVHDSLYFIHFQSTLSALQSFSVAVAYIHTQRPTLRPKSVQQRVR
ncbi:CCT motif family protein isoform 1 [Hibiscus syriacus]|uniref:CCT motif family protein isoform 1 n=1 Tax=Hibiscus syriacus TaxID=106335 RepID=A0A6A3B6D5_HIBSY|nr:CCT motif family protein isoform 1 [Hibiscus syriacus]